jgi:GTPase SAR1 family protein
MNGSDLFFWKKHKIGNFTCPYCYAEHSIKDCGLKCSYNIIGNTDKKCKFEIKKYDDQYGNDWIPQAHKKECINCKEAAQQLFCDETKKEIPIEFLSMKSLPIALLGAKASGKSNYIGVLINEIRKKMTGPFNCSLSMTCSQESKQAYNDLYYRPLYEAGFTVSATDAGVEVPPLIFPLRFMDAKSRIVNMAALTFYDTAGENLNDKNVMHKFNRYITNAHGIILLLDPLQVPNIRQKLIDNGFNALPEQNTEIYDVLSIIIDVIRSVKNIKSQIQIPIALVFTKIDVLEQYNILPHDSCLREESEHIKRGAFIRPDFENTNIQMQDLIDNWLDADLISYIKQFKRHSFFGVSSLGGNPNGTKIDSKGIRPRRVLDPLLWLLAENGYIKTLKE